MNLADLNNRFGLPTLKFVEGPGGLGFAEIDNAGGVATLCLQGAHVVSWWPKSAAEPVIWVSEAAKYGPGKSIRGGVPVCWPWFGPHASDKAFGLGSQCIGRLMKFTTWAAPGPCDAPVEHAPSVSGAKPVAS